MATGKRVGVQDGDVDASGEGTSGSGAAAAAPADPSAPRPGPPPIVGLGASAGGLRALEEFFANMAVDSGVAFVVVTHQPRGQASMLHELLQRKTAMPVSEVTQRTRPAPNHVYTAPPGRILDFLDGSLVPLEPSARTELLLPIDDFFRALARERKERAIAIVLSGTGSDGTQGLRAIKGELGMVMVQQEDSASYAGMPHSAIATGLVDYVAPAAELPEPLVAYVRAAFDMAAHVGGSEEGEQDDDRSEDAEAMQQLFLLLRRRTGHDFSQYKESTIGRRIERRMVVRHVDSLERYVRYLEENPTELDVLFKELLIGVTSFFRDPEAFQSLAAHVAQLVAGKGHDHALRVWVAGCSTGEEAYSIAILLREVLRDAGRVSSVQIFATDLDPDAIEIARAGIYPLGIVSDLSPERIERYFMRQDDSFRIKKDVREMLVFAQQNLIADPPFTKLDLIVCRNLLIYLKPALQKRVLPLFHYALRPGGHLFLGSSESVGTFAHLFAVRDRKWKIYRRLEVPSEHALAELSLDPQSGATLPRGPLPGARGAGSTLPRGTIDLMLRELVPPTVLVHERGDVVHIHGRTGLFLEPAAGPQPHANVFNMARDGLALPLSVAMRQAAADGEVMLRDVRVRTNGDFVLVDLHVRRVSDPDPYRGLFFVSFERARPVRAPSAEVEPDDALRTSQVSKLEQELQHTRESHQATIEELETANEELKSTNEELQSTNEELQSANEELGTSKEEMQSLNEELQTVNLELQGKLEELSRANDDMKNLLNGTDIATLFLDRELNIKRYTEQARLVIRLIPSDVGRPIGDLVSRIHYDRLVDDAREVLRTLVSRETEVRADDGSWYFMRILPYRTTDNVIDGLVLTFVNITTIKRLQESERRLQHVLPGSPVTLFEQDAELRYLWVSKGLFGVDAPAVIGRRDDDLLGPEDTATLTSLKRSVLNDAGPVSSLVTLAVGAESRRYLIYLEPVRNHERIAIGVSGVAVDVNQVIP